MAKNWLVNEMVEALRNGSVAEKEDIGRRFPLTTQLVVGIIVRQDEDAEKILGAMPEYMSVRKIETVLKNGKDVDDVEEDEEQEEEKPAKKEKKEKEDKKTKNR